MTASQRNKRTTMVITPDPAVRAAFYSMEDLRRRCGTPTRPASRSKIYRLIAAQVIPRALKELNGWSVAAVDAALARLDRSSDCMNDPEFADAASPREPLKVGRRRNGDAQ